MSFENAESSPVIMKENSVRLKSAPTIELLKSNSDQIASAFSNNSNGTAMDSSDKHVVTPSTNRQTIVRARPGFRRIKLKHSKELNLPTSGTLNANFKSIEMNNIGKSPFTLKPKITDFPELHEVRYRNDDSNIALNENSSENDLIKPSLDSHRNLSSSDSNTRFRAIEKKTIGKLPFTLKPKITDFPELHEVRYMNQDSNIAVNENLSECVSLQTSSSSQIFLPSNDLATPRYQVPSSNMTAFTPPRVNQQSSSVSDTIWLTPGEDCPRIPLLYN